MQQLNGRFFGEIKEGDLSPRPAGDVNLAHHFVPMVTVLEGIRRAVSSHTTIRTAPGCGIAGTDTAGFAEAVEAAQSADVAIVVVGEKSGLVDGCTSGESRDRVELGLAGVQQALVEAIVATGTPTVVVLINGRPLALPWIATHVPAIIETWVPGEEGGTAIADVLFGDYNPGGKLPLSVPRHVGQVPVYYNHKPSGGRSHWSGSYVDSSAVPLFNQPNELAADMAGINNVLTTGTRRSYRYTEAGALLTLQFFGGMDQFSPIDVVFSFERTHPPAVVRIPVVQQTAAAWRATGGRGLPILGF